MKIIIFAILLLALLVTTFISIYSAFAGEKEISNNFTHITAGLFVVLLLMGFIIANEPEKKP